MIYVNPILKPCIASFKYRPQRDSQGLRSHHSRVVFDNQRSPHRVLLVGS
jgi:hypothetical protein